MAALKELMWLDGALVQLKRYVEEYRMDYASALNEIYTQKVNYALAAIKEEKALLYIADRGNMTIYDANYKKAAYFPIEIINKYLPTYRKYPNVIVEQKVKESKDPKDTGDLTSPRKDPECREGKTGPYLRKCGDPDNDYCIRNRYPRGL